MLLTSFTVSIACLAGFKRPLILSVRPVKLLPSALSSSLFLASENLFIIPVSLSANGVIRFLASSKSPTISLQVWPQPDWAASFKTSHNCVNVLTLVAASSAFFANWSASLISLAFLPDFSAKAFDAYSIASASPYLASASSRAACTAFSDKPVYLATYSLAPDVVNFFKVSVSTSDVSHPVVRDSRNVPSAFIAASAPVPSNSDVSLKASWNIWPPIPA